MAELKKIRTIDRLGPYRLKIWFNDGLAGEWDFSALSVESGVMVEPFRNADFFNAVFLEDGALTWPNGFDWSPEALHADMKTAGVLSFEGAFA